tara:strand:- start:111 stop:458 length:348 start_codon:yes stop_codon:yes gene_type:complete
MGKTYKFHKKDINRYRKVYRYIRKKPVFEFCSGGAFEMIAGYIDFVDEAGPKSYTYPAGTDFTKTPVATATSVDNISNGSANVNVFIESITKTTLQVSVSAPFTGRVHFIIVGQD